MEFLRSTRLIGAAIVAASLTACQGDANGFLGTGLFADDKAENPAPVADAPPAPSAAQNSAAALRPQQETSQQSVELTPDLIRNAQRQLNHKSSADIAVDGIWGNETSGAVREFQAGRGLAVTGELNRNTLAALGVDIRQR